MRRTLFGALAALTALGVVMLVSAVATAAPSSITFVSPSPAEGATLTTNSATFAFTYPKKPNATRTLTCSLAGPTASSGPCNAPVADGSKGAKSGKSYTGLANGSYTLTVSLVLTDGGTATAARHFSVNVPQRHIYWVNSGDGAIGRANLDGSGANQSFIGNGSEAQWGLAVDANHVYWAAGLAIGRANLDGTGVNPSFITDIVAFTGVAVDAGHIYWTDFSNNIGRANLDGTGVNNSFVTGAGGAWEVAVDSGHIYWTNFSGSTIGRANLDGTGVNPSFITGANNSFPDGISVDSGHIYWVNSGTNPRSIGRANLDGTGVNQSFIGTADGAEDVVVDSTYIYWTADSVSDRIGRANLDGTGVNQSFIPTGLGPRGIALDAG